MEKFYILIGCMVYQILLNYVDLRSVLFFAFKLYLNSKEKQNEICHTNSKFVNERRTKYTQTHRHTIRQAKREGPPSAKNMKVWKKSIIWNHWHESLVPYVWSIKFSGTTATEAD